MPGGGGGGGETCLWSPRLTEALPWGTVPPVRMDSPGKLTGETLIVHHIPLVHCQVPDRPCCPPGQRTNPFTQADLGVARAPSHAERDLQADSLLYGCCLKQLSLEVAPAEAPGGQEAKARDPVTPAVLRRQNPFLLDDCEDHSLGQESSFHLHHTKPAFHLHKQTQPFFHLHDSDPAVKPWMATCRLGVAEGQEDQLANDDLLPARNRPAPENMELDEYSCPRGEAAPFCFEEDWANDSDELMPVPEAGHGRTCSCSDSELPRCRCHSLSSQSEPPDHPMGEASDSSCTSSDGVLVNFSALYHKMSGQPHPNLNSGQRSCCGGSGGSGDIDSSSGSPSDSGGAFYLDLHSSPRDSAMSCEYHDPDGPGEACGCRHPHQPPSSPVLDANCNSCPPLCDPCASEGSELTACLQSQARLVVATQNYYKLVTCDLSSQSSPSPAGSSITSCSEELARSSPLLQPTAYYLFQRPPPEESQTMGSSSREESQGEAKQSTLQGQLYVNTSPPMLAGGRPRSRSYDRNLDRSPSARLGSLERMLSCPVKLSETPSGAAVESSPPKRVTSFAELAKGRKKNGSSPPLRASRDTSLEFLPVPEHQKKDPTERHCHSLPPLALDHSLENYPGPECGLATPWKGQQSREVPTHGQEVSEHLFFPVTTEVGARAANLLGQKDIRARADGGAADGKVVRYSKDQRPTSLPIQPFIFQHHFPRQPKARALHSHLAASLSQLYSRSAARTGSHPATSATQPSASSIALAQKPRATVGVLGQSQRSADGAVALGDLGTRRPVPETTRPSPLGSYSPVRSQAPFLPCVGDSSSGSPTPESHPPRSRSCPISANLLPASRPSPALGSHVPSVGAHVDTLKHLTPVFGKEEPKAKVPPATSLPPLLLSGLSLVSAGGQPEPQWKVSCKEEALGMGSLSTAIPRPLKANHLSPQALKWREYRRRNPLGLDRVAGLAGSMDWKLHEGRMGGLPWKSPVFEFPTAWNAGRADNGRLNGPSGRLPQLNYSDFFPDYFSLAEKPPAEFCLSPDGNTESISIDLLQKKSLVKAINMAVDLIVAHFGTSRDPGVKAKLGNSSVSPNVGHLVLKYLCPAIRDLLSDGLKAFVLDMIVGQRRNIPWSIVEASTQLGPSTKVLHALYSKVSQCPELTSHTMRFNAFVFGLLNIRSLEFWFNHLYNHEDLVQVHYQPVGFLPLAHGPCQGLFEEVLLLLQPLSLLPFDLDLLFEHHLRQMGHEQRQRKERLRIKQDLALSAHSTLQLMRTHESGGGGDGWWADQDPGGNALERPAGEGDGGRAKGVAAASGRKEGGADGDNQEQPKAPQGAPEPKKDKQASWWYQLMRSSQVYIEGSSEGPRLVRYEPRKKAMGAKTEGPPPREGVVEGAEACPITEGPPAQEQDRPPRELEEKLTHRELPQKDEPPAREGAKEKVRPFWMGSPPHSVLAELKRAAEDCGSTPKPDGTLEGSGASGGLEGSLPKWGHLFGSRKTPRDSKHTNRLPSGWLSLDRSMLQLVVQTVGAGMWREAPSQPEKKLVPPLPASNLKQPQPLQLTGQSTATQETPLREVKALCHHIATERGQLSFKKGDILRLLGRVDADWLRCTRGAESGLVPTMYVTHTEDEDY